ncbi:MAG: hypothetical protein HY275_00765 [Gemmatimonadetes bacterium]|nr:hypothetical protein [Gemmatimonadota bacterium]
MRRLSLLLVAVAAAACSDSSGPSYVPKIAWSADTFTVVLAADSTHVVTFPTATVKVKSGGNPAGLEALTSVAFTPVGSCIGTAGVFFTNVSQVANTAGVDSTTAPANYTVCPSATSFRRGVYPVTATTTVHGATITARATIKVQ